MYGWTSRNWYRPKAWAILHHAKLTCYTSELERYQVLFRLLVLGGIYSDFCDAAWEEYSEPSYRNWAEPMELDSFLLGQLYATLPECSPEEDENEGLVRLVENEREGVVAALMAGFGGVSELYASLYKSRNAKEPQDDDTYDAEPNQLAAYSWVDQGCGRYR